MTKSSEEVEKTKEAYDSYWDMHTEIERSEMRVNLCFLGIKILVLVVVTAILYAKGLL